MKRTARVAGFVAALASTTPAAALVTDPNFEEIPYATVVEDASVTSMAFAPDGSGRLFVAKKQGELWIVKDGVALPEPFAVVTPTWSANECGLLGVAFDPDFVTSGFVYVFVTVSIAEQRILRFRADGDVGRDETILVGGLPTRGENHDGGALAFGPDGKLYFAIGDLSYDVGHGADLASLGSKLSRVNRDGSTPADNPFVDGSGPNQDLIYARGLRNPFSMTFQPTTGLAWVNVVGTAWEQAFVLGAGDDAGYPMFENDQPAGFVAPTLSYQTNVSTIGGCITGGTFFDSSGASAEYRNAFFWGDFNTGKIHRATVSGTTVTSIQPFAEHRRVVDMTTGPDGDLYYITHAGEGPVMRARFRAVAQGLVVAPLHPFLVEGGSGVFQVRLAQAPVAPISVRIRADSPDVRVTAGGSLTFDAMDWATPKVVRLLASLDEDVTDDVTTLIVSAPGVPSENVTVRVHDEWTGDLPDPPAGGEGGDGGAVNGGGEGGQALEPDAGGTGGTLPLGGREGEGGRGAGARSGGGTAASGGRSGAPGTETGGAGMEAGQGGETQNPQHGGLVALLLAGGLAFRRRRR
jgi:glucose/arabinose dehydrogenase